MSRVLITGGAGFIGSNLVDRLLAEGHSVDVVDDLSTGALKNLADARALGTQDRRFSFHQLDVRAPELVALVERRKPELLIHLAGRVLTDPVADVQLNVLGTINVLEAARVAGVRKVIGVSGAAVYADAKPPFKETNAGEAPSPAGVARRTIADYLRLYRDLHQIEFAVLIVANAYGPRARNGVVAEFAKALVKGEPGAINGDGEQTRDFVYVDDVVDAFVRSTEKGSGLLVNVGTGRQTKVIDVYHRLAGLVDFDEPASVAAPRSADRRKLALDPARARIHLGWQPFTQLDDGLRLTVEWWNTAQ
ncbi:MAG: NAD-dependent epimerase/dehydratase family protein [Acidimicrobiia bacterium]